MRFLKIACTLAFLLLSVAAPLDAQEARSRPASASRINEARTLVEGNRFTDALSILRPLASDAPDGPEQVDVLFLVGLAALGAARHPETPEAEQKDYLDEAIGAFHRILVVRPELVRVRLELARAFYLKGSDGLSRKEFERVLAENPPPPVAANIRRFLGAMRERRRWSGYVGINMAPDTNLNAASEEDTIYLYVPAFDVSLPFRVDDQDRPRSGLGVTAWGGGEYEHPLNPATRLVAGGGVSRTEYAERDFDRTFLFAHAGPRWLPGSRTEMSLLGSAHRSWSGGDPQYHSLGGRFQMSHFLGRRLLVRAQSSYHQREYDEAVHLDGPRSNFSLTGLWQATPITRLEATVGLTREQTESESYRNNGRLASLGTSVDLPRGFTVGLNGEYRWTNYDSLYQLVPSGEPRSDCTRTLSLSLYNRGFTIQGFSPKLVLTRENRESNAQLGDYQKTRAELQFVKLL